MDKRIEGQPGLLIHLAVKSQGLDFLFLGRPAGIGFGDPERFGKILAAQPGHRNRQRKKILLGDRRKPLRENLPIGELDRLFHLFQEMLAADFKILWHEASSSVADRKG